MPKVAREREENATDLTSLLLILAASVTLQKNSWFYIFVSNEWLQREIKTMTTYLSIPSVYFHLLKEGAGIGIT